MALLSIKGWKDFRINPPLYERIVLTLAVQLEEMLSKAVSELSEAELKKVQQSAVDVTLDPDTAHLYLTLSDDGKQVKGKIEWDVGVVRESIKRKEDVPLSPENGYWTIWLRKRIKYKALNDPPVSLFLKSKPKKVGVFVDYEEGLVSFYDVDAASLIYSFTGFFFTEKLYPYFDPGLNDSGKNSAPLVLFPYESQ
ncbi:hypothetical protein Q5P01_025803 [Channa striata]|uniref:B30.2/SPRY domain-containing protein n=1 Tax=Channa striata TaxID=64152 RepID=A0AA88INB2_CHASR|nr:hypothetical protein Q5P01_025803 [Channa striata]